MCFFLLVFSFMEKKDETVFLISILDVTLQCIRHQSRLHDDAARGPSSTKRAEHYFCRTRKQVQD